MRSPGGARTLNRSVGEMVNETFVRPPLTNITFSAMRRSTPGLGLHWPSHFTPGPDTHPHQTEFRLKQPHGSPVRLPIEGGKTGWATLWL